ncbi:MAG TPA: nucleotidyltransferase domain-containing protein [Gaiellaceae bacterium]|nr:nucleotidyltransferase domain-containing protein [Gaiellaceae bacterium]
MFTPEQREEVRARLLERARQDDRITGAALTGSAAQGTEDRWSDVDVFLGVRGDIDEVMDDWTNALGAVHHWDLPSGDAVYRVFLLEHGLQVDIAFTPETSFAARGPSFRVLFGNAVDAPPPAQPAFADVAGLGWLSVLHAFTRIERGRLWEAAYWIASVRDQTLALACLRHGESPAYARGVDRLPRDVTAPLEETFVRSLEPGELRRALRAARRCLIDEIGRSDEKLAAALEPALPGG